jgi:hypothetical protein
MQILEREKQNKKNHAKSLKKGNNKVHANPWKRKSLRRESPKEASYSGQEGEDSVSLTGLCSALLYSGQVSQAERGLLIS